MKNYAQIMHASSHPALPDSLGPYDGEKKGTLYYDDEPLEHILYGEGYYTPEPAGIFLNTGRVVRRVCQAAANNDWPETIAAIRELASIGLPLSAEHCRIIIPVLYKFFPGCPKPLPLPCDPSALAGFLESVWGLEIVQTDKALRKMAADLMIRLYEYLGCYEKARHIIRQILENCRRDGDSQGEASTLNNLGFNYMLDHQWETALPILEQAAALYGLLNIHYNAANSLCNYWLCRFELGDFGDDIIVRAILEKAFSELTASGSWHDRKPLILLARLDEKQGDIRKAIGRVIQAIRTASDGQTRYPAEDRDYLTKLWRQYRSAQPHPVDSYNDASAAKGCGKTVESGECEINGRFA